LKSIAAAKEAGTQVTCEVSPYHLLLTEDDVEDYNTHFKMDPPLRLRSDCDALVQGLLDGTIDAIASNHAPHTEFEKSADFASAPFGVSGLETTVLALFDRFISEGTFGWDLLVKKYSAEPRRIVKLDPVKIAEGEKAEFFIFDPNGETLVSKDYLKTKSSVSPFLGRTLKGAIRETVV